MSLVELGSTREKTWKSGTLIVHSHIGLLFGLVVPRTPVFIMIPVF